MKLLGVKSKWACETCDLRLAKIIQKIDDVDGFIELSSTVVSLIKIVKSVASDNIAINDKVDLLLKSQDRVNSKQTKPKRNSRQETGKSYGDFVSSQTFKPSVCAASLSDIPTTAEECATVSTQNVVAVSKDVGSTVPVANNDDVISGKSYAQIVRENNSNKTHDKWVNASGRRGKPKTKPIIGSNIGKRGLKIAERSSCSCKRKSSTGVNSTFADDYKAIHIPTTVFQKIVLSVGSSFVSLMNPTRGDMIAILGEASGEGALRYMHAAMLESEEGSEILRESPRINSKTINLSKLQSLPDGTVGKVYYDFLEKNKVTPDSRLAVQFVDDVELAYTMQRYRETHDLNHAILGMPTNMLGEVTVKWVEAFQTRLPMCIGGALFGAVRLKPKQRQKYVTTHLPWAIQTGLNSKKLLSVYFEKRWEQPVSELHKELNIVPLKTS